MKKPAICIFLLIYFFSSIAVADAVIMRCEIRALSDDKNYNSPNEEGYITTFGKLSEVQFFKYEHSFFKGHRFYRRNANQEWSDLVSEAEYGNIPVIKKEKYFLFSYPEGRDTSAYEEIDFQNLKWRTGTNCSVSADRLLIPRNRQKCPPDILHNQFMTKCFLE